MEQKVLTSLAWRLVILLAARLATGLSCARMDREEMQRALAEVWKRHLPEISERVDVLERACASTRAGNLTEEEREAAHAAAHKLAGTLGTFGHRRGSDVAKEIEQWFASRQSALEHQEGMLAAISEIRKIVSDERSGQI